MPTPIFPSRRAELGSEKEINTINLNTLALRLAEVKQAGDKSSELPEWLRDKIRGKKDDDDSKDKDGDDDDSMVKHGKDGKSDKEAKCDDGEPCACGDCPECRKRDKKMAQNNARKQAITSSKEIVRSAQYGGQGGGFGDDIGADMGDYGDGMDDLEETGDESATCPVCGGVSLRFDPARHSYKCPDCNGTFSEQEVEEGDSDFALNGTDRSLGDDEQLDDPDDLSGMNVGGIDDIASGGEMSNDDSTLGAGRQHLNPDDALGVGRPRPRHRRDVIEDPDEMDISAFASADKSGKIVFTHPNQISAQALEAARTAKNGKLERAILGARNDRRMALASKIVETAKDQMDKAQKTAKRNYRMTVVANTDAKPAKPAKAAKAEEVGFKDARSLSTAERDIVNARFAAHGFPKGYINEMIKVAAVTPEEEALRQAMRDVLASNLPDVTKKAALAGMIKTAMLTPENVERQKHYWEDELGYGKGEKDSSAREWINDLFTTKYDTQTGNEDESKDE